MNPLEQRKKYFEQYIINKETPTLEILNEIYLSCKSDSSSQHDYFMPFFKLATSFIKINKDNNATLMKWVNLIDYKTLDYTKNSYTNLDMFIIRTLKIMCFSPDDEFINEMYFYHEKLRGERKEPYYHIDYNFTIYLYTNKRNDEARNLFLELIKYNQEDYLIYLPIKFYDLKLSKILIPLILIFNSINKYSYNVIMSYLRKADFVTNPTYLETNPSYNQIRELKRVISDKLMENKVEYNVELGLLKSITKGGHGFIYSNNKSFFIPKQNMKKDYKINKKYFFIAYNSFDKTKNKSSISAFIIKED